MGDGSWRYRHITFIEEARRCMPASRPAISVAKALGRHDARNFARGGIGARSFSLLANIEYHRRFDYVNIARIFSLSKRLYDAEESIMAKAEISPAIKPSKWQLSIYSSIFSALLAMMVANAAILARGRPPASASSWACCLHYLRIFIISPGRYGKEC